MICRAGINTVRINMIQYDDIYITEYEPFNNCFLSMFFKFSIKNCMARYFEKRAGMKKNKLNWMINTCTW